MKIVGWTNDVKPKKVSKGDQIAFKADDDMELAMAIFLGPSETAGNPGDGIQDYSIGLLCRVIATLHEENERLKSKVQRYKDMDEVITAQAVRLHELGESVEL